MDINKDKEIKEFDDFVISNFNALYERVESKNYIAETTYRSMLAAWIEAKKRAVPEGFVLVPRELSADEARKHAEAMFNKVEHMARNEQRDLSESEFELFKNRWIDARTLTIQFDWKAMIEAQEQSHEH